MGSDAERSATSYGAIQNVWDPKLSRGLSDFNTTHLISGDWSYALPFGTGKALLSNSGKVGNAIWGGWQWAGLLGRWSSGFAIRGHRARMDNQLGARGAFAVNTAPVKTHRHIIPGGLQQVFANDSAISSGVMTGSPMRLPYPGEAGERNKFHGDGVFGVPIPR